MFFKFKLDMPDILIPARSSDAFIDSDSRSIIIIAVDRFTRRS